MFAISRFQLMVLLNLFLVYISWGSSYLGMRITLQVLGPFFTCAARMIAAGCLLMIFVKLIGQWRRPSRADWLRASRLAVFMVVMGSGFVCKGEEYISSGIAAVISGTTPISMLLGVWLFVGEKRPTAAQAIGLCLGFLGIVLLASQSPGGHAQVSMQGLFWVLGATFGWVWGTILSKRMPESNNLPPLMACSLLLLMGGVESLFLGLLFGEWTMTRWENLSPSVYIAFSWMVIGGSIMAYASYMWLLRHVSTAVSISYEYVVPVIGIFLGWLLGGESLSWPVAGSCAMIITAVFFVVEHKKSAPETLNGSPAQPLTEDELCAASALPRTDMDPDT